MSDREVPFEAGKQGDQAVLLLEAAQSLDLPGSVVRTYSAGFVAPDEVVDKAFGKGAAEASREAGPQPAVPQDDKAAAPKAAKKAAAKKSSAKKSQTEE